MEKPLDLTNELQIVRRCYQRAIKYLTDKNPAAELLKQTMARIEDAVKALRAAAEVATPSEADKIVALTAYRTLMEESLPAQWQVPDGLTAKELGAWVELRAGAWELLFKALRLDRERLIKEIPRWARCPVCGSRLAPLIEQRIEERKELFEPKLTVRYQVRIAVCEKGHRFSIKDLPAQFKIAVRDSLAAMAELTRQRLKQALENLEQSSETSVVEGKWVVEWQPKFTVLVSAASEEEAREKAAVSLGADVEDFGAWMIRNECLPDEAIVRAATEEDVKQLPPDEGDGK